MFLKEKKNRHIVKIESFLKKVVAEKMGKILWVPTGHLAREAGRPTTDLTASPLPLVQPSSFTSRSLEDHLQRMPLPPCPHLQQILQIFSANLPFPNSALYPRPNSSRRSLGTHQPSLPEKPVRELQ